MRQLPIPVVIIRIDSDNKIERIEVSKKLRPVTIKLEESLVEQLDNIAMRKGITRSELIRRAIKKYITRD